MISSRDIVEITISIHAPTRGATKAREIDFVTSFISIHAPTRGATISRFVLRISLSRFQSTLLQEERHSAIFSFSVF